MIKPSDMVKHLKTYLPMHTDEFTSLLTISSAAVSAGNILTVDSIGHGLSIGQSIVISGGTIRNPLIASLLSDPNVIFTTGTDHDLIRPSQPLDDQTLTLAGFGSVWDGSHNIIDVTNRENFTVSLPAGEVAAPVVDGSQYLVENLRSGVYTVATVPDLDSFTLDLSGSPELPIGTVDDLKVISGFRISAAADYNRARAVYAEQSSDEPYLFVIMTDTDVSKDRHTLNDGVAGMTRQDEMLLRLFQSFSTTVFIPTVDDVSGYKAQDLAYGDIFEALVKALFGYQPDSAQVRYLNVPSGHGPGEYNSAFYVHVYDWQLPDVINFEDGFLDWPDVAFRDIVQTLKLFNDNEAEMVLNINLDDEPL